MIKNIVEEKTSAVKVTDTRPAGDIGVARGMLLGEVAQRMDHLENRIAGLVERFAAMAVAKGLDPIELEPVVSEISTVSICQSRLMMLRFLMQSVAWESAGSYLNGCPTRPVHFRRPILEAMIQLGGKARVAKIAELVELAMRHVLNDYDKMRLPSNGILRWVNSMHACGDLLFKSGLVIRPERGVWEISSKGKEWLQKRRTVRG